MLLPGSSTIWNYICWCILGVVAIWLLSWCNPDSRMYLLMQIQKPAFQCIFGELYLSGCWGDAILLVLGSVRFEDKSVDATLLVLVASEISVDVFLIGDISASTALMHLFLPKFWNFSKNLHAWHLLVHISLAIYCVHIYRHNLGNFGNLSSIVRINAQMQVLLYSFAISFANI